MADKTSGASGGGRRPTGNTGRNRNAFCSFCRKSYKVVGPLVEGPGDVYICGECIELCQSIIVQEKRRREGNVGRSLDLAQVREKLDRLVLGQEQAKHALVVAAAYQEAGGGHVLL